jgi:hypothetical protein
LRTIIKGDVIADSRILGIDDDPAGVGPRDPPMETIELVRSVR